MSELEQVPDELASLFAAERAAPVVDAAARTAAKARMVAAVAHVPLGTAGAAGAATTLAGSGKVIAILALTLGVGAGTIALVKHADRTA
ncbi:MAG: hypothetical protein HOV81_00395, partial [Kofleriaceae bacterium]|nr:hypothetical protein [Kofleriaceae bacterium]